MKRGLEGKNFENIGGVGEWKREKEFFFCFVLVLNGKFRKRRERREEIGMERREIS